MSVQGATTGPGQDPAAAFNTMEIFMSGLERSLGRSLGPLEKISKQMGGSKFGKNAKALGGALKGMAGASVQAWAMEQLMKLIEPFMKLLQLLEIPINVLSALLSVMVNEIFVQLLPYIIWFSMELIKLMPYFKIAGEFIGKYLIVGIQKLVEWIVIAFNWFKAFIPLLTDWFIGAWENIKNFFAGLGAWFGNFFVRLWNGIKRGFNVIINWFIGIINTVIGWMNKIPGVDIGSIALLQQGGITTAVTPAILHPNEAVIPLDRASEFGFGGDPRVLAELEEGNRLQRIQIKQNKERDAWRL